MYGYVQDGDRYVLYGGDAVRGSEEQYWDAQQWENSSWKGRDFVYTGDFLMDGSKEIAVIEQYTKFVVTYTDGIVKFLSREIVDSIPDDVDMITPLSSGDADGDGKVNVRDLGLIQQHLNSWNVAIHESACDVNNDGKINVRDLGCLQQYLNGWDIELI